MLCAAITGPAALSLAFKPLSEPQDVPTPAGPCRVVPACVSQASLQSQAWCKLPAELTRWLRSVILPWWSLTGLYGLPLEPRLNARGAGGSRAESASGCQHGVSGRGNPAGSLGREGGGVALVSGCGEEFTPAWLRLVLPPDHQISLSFPSLNLYPWPVRLALSPMGSPCLAQGRPWCRAHLWSCPVLLRQEPPLAWPWPWPWPSGEAAVARRRPVRKAICLAGVSSQQARGRKLSGVLRGWPGLQTGVAAGSM